MPKSIASPAPEDDHDDTELLQEICEKTTYAFSRWSEIRAQGDLNMRALSIIGPWPQEEIDQRDLSTNKRPHGHTDIISQYNERVKNQWRMNPRGVKVDQTGEGATDKTAELREARLREIAYHSQAKAARLCAFGNAVDRGYGVWEVYADYESPKTFKQQLCVGTIQNPNSVLVDPDTVKLDRSDMKFAIKLGKTMQEKEFKRKYKQARDLSSFSSELLGMAKPFTDGKTVTPAEYFRVVYTTKKLLKIEIVQGPERGKRQEICQEDLRDGLTVKGKFIVENGASVAAILESRDSEFPKVEKYITNGLQILKREVLPISTIPLIVVVAKEKYENDVLVIEALTAKMREPQLNYDIAIAGKVEALNMVPKSKWVVSDEQILGYEDQWQNAHRNPTAYLTVHEYDRNGRQMAHPERTDYEAPIQAYVLAGNDFQRDVQNTVGMASAERVDRVSKSGIAQEKLNESADIASYHIVDNMVMALEYEGRIENEWIALIEDSERTVGLRKPDGKYVTERIRPTEQDGKITHPYGEADDHSVTIGTGPDYASQRAEKVEVLRDIIKQPDFLANPLSPMVIHELELGPGGDKMEKIALSVQPPAVQAAYDEGDEGREPIPPQALQAIEQLKKENAEAKEIIRVSVAKLEEIQQQLESKQLELTIKAETEREKIQANKEIEAMRLAADKFKATIDLQIARMNNAVKLEVAHDQLTHDENMAEHTAEHADSEAERSRQHEREMKDVEETG